MVVRKGVNPSILRYGHLQPGLKVLPHQYLTPKSGWRELSSGCGSGSNTTFGITSGWFLYFNLGLQYAQHLAYGKQPLK